MSNGNGYGNGERGKQGDHGQDGRRGIQGEQGEIGETGETGKTGPAPVAKWFDLTDNRLIIIFVVVVFIGVVGFNQIQKNSDRINENAYLACVNSARIIKLLNAEATPTDKIAVPVCRRP